MKSKSALSMKSKSGVSQPKSKTMTKSPSMINGDALIHDDCRQDEGLCEDQD